MATSELATRQKPAVLMAIEQAKVQFEGRIPKSLPNGMTADRFMFGLATCIQKNPALLECDAKSVILAGYEAAELGINLSPSLGLAYIIPYGKVAQFQLGYRGMVQKTHETGAIATFFAEVVYSNDKFERQFAPKRNIFHVPADGDRGVPIGAYALVQFKNSDVIEFEYMSKEQIDRHRNHSKQPDSLMWKKFWEEGWRKTPIRVLWKRLPLSNPELEKMADLIEHEAERERAEEPAGRLEVEVDSPLRVMPKVAPAPPTPPENQAAATPAAPVYIQVDKQLTIISGGYRPIESDLPKVGGRWDKVARVWTMPAARTEELVSLCNSKNLPFVELDANGQPLVRDEQDQREPGMEEEPAGLPFS